MFHRAATELGAAMSNRHPDNRHGLGDCRIAKRTERHHRAALATIDHREVLACAHDCEPLVRHQQVLEVRARRNVNDIIGMRA